MADKGQLAFQNAYSVYFRTVKQIGKTYNFVWD